MFTANDDQPPAYDFTAFSPDPFPVTQNRGLTPQQQDWPAGEKTDVSGQGFWGVHLHAQLSAPQGPERVDVSLAADKTRVGMAPGSGPS